MAAPRRDYDPATRRDTDHVTTNPRPGDPLTHDPYATGAAPGDTIGARRGVEHRPEPSRGRGAMWAIAAAVAIVVLLLLLWPFGTTTTDATAPETVPPAAGMNDPVTGQPASPQPVVPQPVVPGTNTAPTAPPQ